MKPWVLVVLPLFMLSCRSEAGPSIRHTGYLEIAPYTRGKNTRSVTVHCPNKERVMIDVHYDKKYLEFVNKGVVIEGGPPPPPEDDRIQRAIYFHVSDIELAPGEKPWDPPPARAPAPALVTSQADIDALKGAWGMATGSATFVFEPPLSQKAEMYTLTRTLVSLTDGTQLSHTPYRAVHKTNIPRYENAKQATILFETTQNGKRVSHKSCLGEAPRCGVED